VKIRNVVIEVLGSDSVKVSWQKLDPPPVTRYRVFYKKRDGSQVQPETEVVVAGNVTSVVINETFDPGLYDFEVVAEHRENGTVRTSKRSDVSIMLLIDNNADTSKLPGIVLSASDQTS